MIRNKLRVLGCLVLAASFVLAACRPEETTKKKRKKKTTAEQTETTDEPSESTEDTEPTEPTEPTDTDPSQTLYPPTTARDPKDTIYFGADAVSKLHELDEEIFKEGKTDIISLVYDVEDPEKLGISWPTVGIEPYDPDSEIESYEFNIHVLDTLDEIDFNSLELEDQILYETIKSDYELSLEMAVHLFPVLGMKKENCECTGAESGGVWTMKKSVPNSEDLIRTRRSRRSWNLLKQSTKTTTATICIRPSKTVSTPWISMLLPSRI